jgi:[ribosomal protein S18]-alanine N-acetyltransferase
MAVLQTIKSLFIPARPAEPERIVPAPPTEYAIKPLTTTQIKELLQLNLRCFTEGDSYNKHTLNYLLNEPTTVSYCAVTPSDELVAFVFAMINKNGAAHLTTIGVAPEHRRRGLAQRVLKHLERKLKAKDIGTIMLEVRVGNLPAQNLYRQLGYTVVQRINNYYSNGEDCYLMMKSLV